MHTANDVLNSGVELVGMASALAMSPDLVNQWQDNADALGVIPKVTWKDKTLAGLATMAIIKRQLRRMSKDKLPKHKNSPVWSLITDQVNAAKLTKRYRKRYSDEVN